MKKIKNYCTLLVISKICLLLLFSVCCYNLFTLNSKITTISIDNELDLILPNPPDESAGDISLLSTYQEKKSNNYSNKNDRYHQVQIKDTNPSRNMYTAHQDATTILKASWFEKQKKCIERCCVERVAISLDQDDTRLINTVDGPDLAELMMQGHRQPDELEYFASQLSDVMIPCMKPGTIIHIDSYHGTLKKRFFPKLHSKIQSPYVLITSETDEKTPDPLLQKKYIGDDKILRWYGTNPVPSIIAKEHKHKFESFPLGLSKYHKQTPLLSQYLEATHFFNPFKNKRHWTESMELKTANNITNLMFVKFSVPPWNILRKKAWDAICEVIKNKTEVPTGDGVSCSQSEVSMHETYRASSKYLFGLCPGGMGADTHRIYEFLYLGIIPVVDPSFMGSFDYKNVVPDLPIVILDKPSYSYSQTEIVQVMRDYIASDKFKNNDFVGWERLYLKYWRRHIIKDAGRTDDIVTDPISGKEYFLAWKYSLHDPPVIEN